MSPSPEVLTALADWAPDCHWSLDVRHMAVLADEASLLLPVPVFVFGVGAARPAVIKLRRSAHDAVTALTQLCGPECRIVFCRMGSFGVIVRSQDHAVSYVAGCAGDSFPLIVFVIVWIWFLDGPLNSIAGDVMNQRGLLVFQRCVTVETDPDVFVLCPIGLEEGIVIGLCMNGGLPFVIDLSVAGAARLCFQARETFWDLLLGNGMGIVRPQPKNDDRLHFGVVQVCEPAEDGESDHDSLYPSHGEFRSVAPKGILPRILLDSKWKVPRSLRGGVFTNLCYGCFVETKGCRRNWFVCDLLENDFPGLEKDLQGDFTVIMPLNILGTKLLQCCDNLRQKGGFVPEGDHE